MLPVNIPDVWNGPWETLGSGKDTIEVHWLFNDKATGSYIALLRFPAGWEGHLTTPSSSARTWILLEGDWQMEDGTSHSKGAFYHGPKGSPHGAVVGSASGCIVFTEMIADA